MYCPSCGSNNQLDLKFCTRCGTNLGVVADALSGRTQAAVETDERTITLLKDYYRSRRMMFIGGAASALALFKLAGPFMLGFPEKLIPVVILSLVFLLLSLLAFVWGLVKWNNSSSELKALGVERSKTKRLRPRQEQSLIPADQSIIGAPSHPTDPIAPQSSVTEHTTHILDEEAPSPASRGHLGEA